MPDLPPEQAMGLAPSLDAAQHRPRPLPLFLSMLRSEIGNEPARLEAALQGLRTYQRAPRPASPPRMPEVARIGRATVRAYGVSGPPVLFVPSLINPPDVLDLDEERSLLRWLVTQGVRPLLLDWGTPLSQERDLTVAGHIETLLLPLLDKLGEPVSLAGYCLGGTMALAAAQLRPVRSLALIAAPWRFSAYPPDMRGALEQLWDGAFPSAQEVGMMPMEVLQAAFWRIDPARTVAKFEAFGRRDPDETAARAFVRLEDWANDGPPLSFGAARELFEELYSLDLPGEGRWRVGGEAIDPSALDCPVLEIASTTDRIVPAAASVGIGERINLALGHVGMIVGGRARRALWEPLAAWLSRP